MAIISHFSGYGRISLLGQSCGHHGFLVPFYWNHYCFTTFNQLSRTKHPITTRGESYLKASPSSHLFICYIIQDLHFVSQGMYIDWCLGRLIDLEFVSGTEPGRRRRSFERLCLFCCPEDIPVGDENGHVCWILERADVHGYQDAPRSICGDEK